MKSYTRKRKEEKSRPKASQNSQAQAHSQAVAQLTDNRTKVVVQQKLQESMENSPRIKQLKAIQELAVQRGKKKEEETGQGKFTSIQKKPDGNPTGLPGQLKSGAESLSGMDMSDVKVHYNSDKPSQLQAHAYARGTDIHLAPGQEKHLPHETWHVVQQKQGRVKPTLELQGARINDDSGLEKEADKMGRAALQAISGSSSVTQAKRIAGYGVVQREWKEDGGIKMWDKILDGVTWFATGPGEMWYNITFPSQVKEGSLKAYQAYEGQRKSYGQWKALGLGASVTGKLKEESASTIDKAHDFVGAITEPAATVTGYEGVSGVSDALLGRTVKTGTGGDTDVSKQEMKVFGKGTGKSKKEVATAMGVGADTITGLTGITGFIKGFKDATDPAKAADKRFVAFLEYEQGAMSMGESASKLTATATGSGTAAKFGSSFEGFAAGIGAIKEAFQSVKKSVDLISAQDEDLSSSEKIKAKAEVGLHALESAKGAVLSIKAFYEMVKGAAAGELMAAVPGLGIAVSAVKLSMQGYYAVQSYHSFVEMNMQQNEVVAKTAAPGKGPVEKRAALKEASDFYRSNDAKISNKQEVIAENKEEIERIDAKPDKSTEDTKRKTELEEENESLTADIEELKSRKFEKADLSKEDLAEFTLVTELSSINDKRVKRQLLHIATEMTKIAGEVAVLSGVGAIGGAIAKGSAVAVELGATTARTGKQMGRSYAAKKEARKPLLKKHSTMFDTSKSDAAKKDFRLQQVRTLLKIAIDIGTKKYGDTLSLEKDQKKLETYLRATGVDIDTLYTHNGKPDEQVTLLFQALSKREFLE